MASINVEGKKCGASRATPREGRQMNNWVRRVNWVKTSAAMGEPV